MSAASILAFFDSPKRGFIQPSDRFVPGADGHGPVHLQLDAMISEAPDYQANPTQTQVEDGSTISDHVTLKPLKLVVQGIVTDTPVGFIREFSSAFQSPSPSQNAFDFIVKLWKERIPFDFVGGLTVYSSMVITSFNPTNTSETGSALRFTCTMEQIRTVSSQNVLRFTKRAQKKQSVGQQPLKPVKSPVNLQDSFHGVEPTAGTVGTIPTGVTHDINPLSYVGKGVVSQAKTLGFVGGPTFGK